MWTPLALNDEMVTSVSLLLSSAKRKAVVKPRVVQVDAVLSMRKMKCPSATAGYLQVSTVWKSGVPERRMQQKDVKQRKWHA